MKREHSSLEANNIGCARFDCGNGEVFVVCI